MGTNYRERRQKISKWFKQEFAELESESVTTDNPYFTNLLFQNYIYKGPVLEWYMRVKVHMEHSYKVFNDLIPRDASIMDIGCGYGFPGLYADVHVARSTDNRS